MTKRQIKKRIREFLRVNGFKESEKDFWYKATPRMEVHVTLHRQKLEVYVREHPIKEGWSDRFYPYEEGIENKIELPRY